LIVYNGGIKASVTILYAYVFLAQPITTAVAMPIRIERIRKGRFASRAIVTVPKIANGAGSLTSFSARIGRSFARKGKRMSVLTAKCQGGKIHTRAEANFVDGTSIQSLLVRTCVPSD
jgi:rhamnose utilization protein RhaD (predicted bifunctional aldolase and dehydrogenase)